MPGLQPSGETPQDVTAQSCDVCIVGAGIAGLNALFVASRYLSRDQKVILVDRRERVGGMWVDTYPYVRLHQPHPMFTAGNIQWTLGHERSYLATKGEVLDHLAHCLTVMRQRIQLTELFGWAMESDEEIAGKVRITCRSSAGRVLVVEAKRLIKAFGFGVVPNDPLDISSERVRSVSPDFCDMRDGEMRNSDTPVWIVGGGKTAMDTAHALITEYPGREVNLVAGSGTYFMNRDRVLPMGRQRWWGGRFLSNIGVEATRRFDGTNEKEVAAWFRRNYGMWLTPTTGNFLLGVLSEAENETIAAGLNDVVMDHLVDAVDRNGATDLVFRSGATAPIKPGSWIVNCTGYFKPGDHPYEPYVSGSGAVLSIQPRSATMHLTSYMGYYLTHLLFLDKITDIPLYELDAEEMRTKAREAFPYTLFSLVQYNLSMISDNVGASVFLDCGLDFDRWYPWPRRMTAMVKAMLTHRRRRPHVQHTLDTVRERFDVRCGPLIAGAAPTMSATSLIVANDGTSPAPRRTDGPPR